ncbi:hypothetical protein [Parasphingorhabdus pacifica]
MSFPPQQPGPQGPWESQQGAGDGYSGQDPSQDFWRQVAAGQQDPNQQAQYQQAQYQQDPYQQAQYQQAPYQHAQYQQSPYEGWAQHPPPASGGGKNLGLIAALVAVGIVVVVGGGLVAFLSFGVSPDSGGEAAPATQQQSDDPAPQADPVLPGSVRPGDCIDIGDSDDSPVTTAECGSFQSDYEVAEVIDVADLNRCPDTFAITWEGETFCVLLDAKQGDCLAVYQDDPSFVPWKVDCSSSDNPDQVTKVADVANYASVCSENEGYYSFVDPPRTVCFAPVEHA